MLFYTINAYFYFNAVKKIISQLYDLKRIYIIEIGLYCKMGFAVKMKQVLYNEH